MKLYDITRELFTGAVYPGDVTPLNWNSSPSRNKLRGY